jgi:hypothetical protein
MKSAEMSPEQLEEAKSRIAVFMRDRADTFAALVQGRGIDVEKARVKAGVDLDGIRRLLDQELGDL